MALQELVPEVTTAQVTDIPPTAIIEQELQAYAGPNATFSEAISRQDFTGPARYKKLIGGALIIKYDLLTPDGVQKKELEIDEQHRPLSEQAIALGGLIAEENIRKDPAKRRIRDIS